MYVVLQNSDGHGYFPHNGDPEHFHSDISEFADLDNAQVFKIEVDAGKVRSHPDLPRFGRWSMRAVSLHLAQRGVFEKHD